MSSLSSVGGSSGLNSLLTPSSSTTGNTSSSNSSSSGSGLIGLNDSGVSFQGLASGLNTDQIVKALLASQQQEITNLQNQQANVVQRESIYNTLQANLTALQSAVNSLSSTTSSVFDGRTATSSNTNLATASASSSAQPGIYSFTVNSLAQAQEIASQGFDSANSAITQGTFQFQVGSGAVNTITINGTNDTLQGLANAINTANAGATASLINDGSSAQGYHLLLTANKSGTANAITITNNLAASGSGATQPVFNQIVQAAADASITLGSGSGAMTVTSSSNTIDNVFNGITLNLVGANPSQPVAITVANNTQAETTAVTNFVSAYNAVIGFINQNDSYNTQTQQGGILLGDFQATSIFSTLAQSVTSAVGGVNTVANNLSALGITINADGTLTVNSNTLNQAVGGQLPGVSTDDVRRLFVQDGQSTNNAVQYVYSPSTLKAIDTPIQVQITQAATQGSATATNALAASTTITSGSNDTFSLTVNGQTSSPIVLPAGTYTPQQLAQQVQSAINSGGALKGQQVLASVNSSGHLVLTSQTYGSKSTLAMGSGDALAALGLSGSESGTGQDVAGSFLVDGVSEPATGNGQTLTGNSTNKETAGLVVLSTLTPAQVSSSPEASVTVTQGIGSQMGNLLNQMLDPVNGQLTTFEQSLQKQASGIGQSITQLQQSLQLQQAQLLQEFAQMESNLAAIQSVGATLSASLTGISPSSNSTSSGSSGSGTTLG
jgi:flagellar hook-associated protein 2